MDLSELYRERSSTINRHPWEVTRARIICFILKKEKRKFEHIFDIGSGDAYVLSQLNKKGLANNYSAVDTGYTDEIINKLKSQRGFESINFLYSAGDPKKPNKIDCILLLDVLEHCENDQMVLSESISLLKEQNDATVLITVPAFQMLFSDHDRLLKHYRRYTRKNIQRLCLNNNLTIKKSGYFFFSLLVVRLIKNLIGKLGFTKNEKTIDNWKGGPFISKLISAFLWCDFRVCYFLSNLGIHLPGLSCYCLC
jgi:hypothetical protein